MEKISKIYYKSPVGILEIVGTNAGVSAVTFLEGSTLPEEVDLDLQPACLSKCLYELQEYFQGSRHNFTVQLSPQGTVFQKQVWSKLCQISYGKTISYQELANAVDNPKAVRAVGSANGRNKINILIPCHRVIGTNGKLTGYGGGLWRKEWLLEHEKENALD